VRLELLRQLNQARAAGRRACLVRLLATHDEILLVEGRPAAGASLPDDLHAAVEAAQRQDRSTTVETIDGLAFIQVFNPPLRLVIVGAVHIAQALAPMAALMGYAVTVVDPRGSFATDARFPGVTLDSEWPDEALEALAPDRRTAIVTLTHDPKLDDPALDVALRSGAFYIAALGSKRTHAGRVERLKALGHDEGAIARIHGPAGIDIGAVSPAEIAVSVLAEMTAALRKEA
jgi:xanthine dehydrogenase accessory factor